MKKNNFRSTKLTAKPNRVYSYLLMFVRYIYRMWNHCDMIQDYLSIYDGKNTNFPEIARICGGDALPDIISSGPDMLIVFKSSAFDTLYHPSPNSYLLGFELQVEVSAIIKCCFACAAKKIITHVSSMTTLLISFLLQFAPGFHSTGFVRLYL